MGFVVIIDNKYFYINDNHGRFTDDISKATLFKKGEAKRIAIQLQGVYKSINDIK